MDIHRHTCMYISTHTHTYTCQLSRNKNTGAPSSLAAGNWWCPSSPSQGRNDTTGRDQVPGLLPEDVDQQLLNETDSLEVYTGPQFFSIDLTWLVYVPSVFSTETLLVSVNCIIASTSSFSGIEANCVHCAHPAAWKGSSLLQGTPEVGHLAPEQLEGSFFLLPPASSLCLSWFPVQFLRLYPVSNSPGPRCCQLIIPFNAVILGLFAF